MTPTIALIGSAAFGLAFIVYAAWPYLPAWPSKTPVVPVETDPDALDVAAMKRLQARFKRLNCPEGTAAMMTVGTHFFHEGA